MARMTFLSLCFSHRHFLFKQGSGSSALLSGTGQGYPLTSGTVYSPPPRPLPRSSVTRPLFTFNKPHRCCNWKCTALSASLLTLTLALLLTYVIGELQSHINHRARRCVVMQSCTRRLAFVCSDFSFFKSTFSYQIARGARKSGGLSRHCLINSKKKESIKKIQKQTLTAIFTSTKCCRLQRVK